MQHAPTFELGLLAHSRLWRGMIRGWRTLTTVLLLSIGLSACSWVSLGYNRLPEISRLWLDKQLKLDATQTDALREDLQALLQWHRQHQLPTIGSTLRRWQQLVVHPTVSAEQICQETAQVRGLVQALGEQALPSMVRLGQRLGSAQYAALEASQKKSHAEFRKEWLEAPRQGWLSSAQASPEPSSTVLWSPERVQQRLKQLQTRYEMLYGSLSTVQQQALAQSLTQSSFDPVLALAERERRTQDLLQTLHALRALPVDPEDRRASALVQAWLARLHTSPNPDYARANRVWQQEICAQFAEVHRLSTAEQRQYARQTLADYEAQAQDLIRR